MYREWTMPSEVIKQLIYSLQIYFSCGLDIVHENDPLEDGVIYSLCKWLIMGLGVQDYA